MDLCSPSTVKRLLADHSLSPRKSLGQNFLINPHIPEMIAEASYSAAVSSSPQGKPLGVIEIGPGVGALTQQLAEVYDKVVAVEIDPGLFALLSDLFSESETVTLVHGDFLKTDLSVLIAEQFGDMIEAGGTFSVCANLPYYITTPIIMKILESFDPADRVPISSITVMIQKEVADRLASPPGGTDYGAVTASIALKANVKKLFDVSSGSFFPPPKVSSTVIGIVPHGGIREVFPACPDGEECAEFFREVSDVISLAFSQRRKTLCNALCSRFPKDKISSALEVIGKRDDVRGEKLSAEDFCTLTAELLKAEKG